MQIDKKLSCKRSIDRNRIWDLELKMKIMTVVLISRLDLKKFEVRVCLPLLHLLSAWYLLQEIDKASVW